jgi:hypothetical protein
MLWHLESVEPTVHDAICADVLRVHEQVGESTLSYFNQGPGDVPAPSFLFYTRRIVPPVTSKHLGPGETDRPPFIMSSNDERSHRRLSKAGYQPIAEFRDAPSNLRFLWHDGPP